ncbi:MAG: hypothetical protein Q8L60_09700 [Gammaproteobacteria bacterium]|nr:hypothetical protein [Gammaproteobacteria bacterium]MDP2139706.1 hypothetical protein [Gammaproteobacteria bacterium]MDP2348909.1 hypothetical protein [Gammaproteobacteria bacterium]
MSKDESGLSKERLHSSNYLETLDVIRDGLIGAAFGFCAGVLFALLSMAVEPFGPNVPLLGYVAMVFVLSCFGAWVGGLVGIASENKKLANFHDAIEEGKYLILIYAKKDQESKIMQMMDAKHKEAQLAAIDAHFLNPFAQLKLS